MLGEHLAELCRGAGISFFDIEIAETAAVSCRAEHIVDSDRLASLCLIDKVCTGHEGACVDVDQIVSVLILEETAGAEKSFHIFPAVSPSGGCVRCVEIEHLERREIVPFRTLLLCPPFRWFAVGVIFPAAHKLLFTQGDNLFVEIERDVVGAGSHLEIVELGMSGGSVYITSGIYGEFC